ncbi:RPA-interacting protein isoform X1 [Bos indicus x Bos taurus]|uniref:RPA-interacting protein isoform X1 n=1 Tax=Bos indicus x Bos taurus TaxID=30522 RepID=UPI000F7D0C09|nr:RPA-interacting protein isoform X1 [Bos indicus x Bos taurus]
MAERPGSRHHSLYKLTGSPPWKEAFRQGCLERMRNSRDRLLSKYRQAGGSMSGGAQNTLLVQEVMEEEWNALQSVESWPQAWAQLEEPMDLAVLEEIQQELIDQALGTGRPGDAVTLQLYSALQNSPSSVSTRRACSLTNSVSASCLLSGKQTPSSVPCVQSKSFHNLFSTVRSHPPLQGEWNFPQICGLGRWGDTGLLAVMLWDPNSASRYNLRIAGGLVVCQCGLYIQSHSPEVTEQKLRACLEDSVNEHSAHCPHTPEFSVTEGTEEKSCLLMSCLACDTWAVIL